MFMTESMPECSGRVPVQRIKDDASRCRCSHCSAGALALHAGQAVGQGFRGFRPAAALVQQAGSDRRTAAHVLAQETLDNVPGSGCGVDGAAHQVDNVRVEPTEHARNPSLEKSPGEYDGRLNWYPRARPGRADRDKCQRNSRELPSFQALDRCKRQSLVLQS